MINIKAPALTRHEKVALEALADGLTNPELALQLGISETSVVTVLKKLYMKLAAKNRPHAVAEGFRCGLLK